MKARKYLVAATALAFLFCVLLANYVTTRFGTVWVFGLTATAGTYFAGATFVLRDSLQRMAGLVPAIALIVLGAALSFAIADPFIALASAVAFGFSELADLAVWTPLERRGYIRAAIASNIAGALVDTLLFLSIAGFGLTGEVVAGQFIGKMSLTLLVILAVSWSGREAKR